jgi:hypothetical protein
MRKILLAALLAAGCDEPKSAPKPDIKPAAEPAPTPTPGPTASVVQETPSATAVAASAAPSANAAAPVASAAPVKGKDAGAPAVAALKPVSHQMSGNNFSLDVASPGCRANEECAMTIKLVTAADYHVNKEYPYKFVASPAQGVSFLGKADPNTFGRPSGDFVEQGEKSALLTVRFKPTTTGEARIAGKYKLSVCSADRCQIDEAMVDLAVPVL